MKKQICFGLLDIIPNIPIMNAASQHRSLITYATETPLHKLIVFAGGLSVLAFCTGMMFPDSASYTNWIQSYVSYALNFVNTYRGNARKMVNYFRELPLDPPHNDGMGHSHPYSASMRGAASKAMERFAAHFGLIPYHLQMSNYDQREGKHGSRSYYWSRDMTMNAQQDEFEPNVNLRILTDVDYYIDIPSMLSTACTTMIYTLNPTSVARVADEYSYNFNSNNEINYIVNGGGRYTHQIWNFNMDHVVVYKKWLGINVGVVHYQIDRRTISQDRDLVLLTPFYEAGIIGLWLSKWITQPELQRLKVNQGVFNKLEIKAKSGHTISVAYCEPGQYTAANVPITVDNYVRNLVKIQSTGLATYNVQAMLKYPPEDQQKSLAESAILVGYHTSLATMGPILALFMQYFPRPVTHTLFPMFNPQTTIVFPVEYSIRKFDFDIYGLPTQPMLTPFMSAFINEGYVPLKSKANEERAVAGRVTEVKTPHMELDDFTSVCMTEFVQRLFPVAMSLHPVDVDRVFEQQNRPTQRSILERALFLPIRHIKQKTVSFFLKSESYSKPADPRIISTMEGTVKYDASRFMYGLADQLASSEWYAFSKTPMEIATKVANICIGAVDGVSLSDFSRMDGHIGNILRELDRRVLLTAFHKSHHEDIIIMLKDLVEKQSTGKYGTKFDSDQTQCSGDPWTAILNSIRNLFIHFLTRRRTRIGSRYYTADEAFTWLQTSVLVGGDDGIAADVNEKPFTKACQSVGQVLDYAYAKRGEFGVNFLSRYYTKDVWTGDPNNCCDIKRQLIKFHLSAPLDGSVTPIMKLVEKARSFVLTDGNTPIIGPFCKKVMSLSGNTASNVQSQKLQTWLSKQGPVPNDFRPDYYQLLERDLPKINCLHEFQSWVDSCRNLSDCLRPFALTPMEPAQAHKTQDVVVDGIIVHCDKPKLPPGKPKFSKPNDEMNNTPTLAPKPPQQAPPKAPATNTPGLVTQPPHGRSKSRGRQPKALERHDKGGKGKQ